MKTINARPDLLEEIRKAVGVAQADLEAGPAAPGLIPLEIKCKMSSCVHGRHCLDHLRSPRPGSRAPEAGECRDCLQHVVWLPTGHKRDYGSDQEILDTSAMQQRELIRAHYWRVAIDLRAYNQALRLGRRELDRRLAVKIERALTVDDAFAGRGAAYSGDIVAYAQHAVAACCRQCAAYWHGLPADRGQVPTPEQLRHVVTLARTYLDLRLPNLPEEAAPPGDVHPVRSTQEPGLLETEHLDDKLLARLMSGADPAGLLRPRRSTLRISDSVGRSGGRLAVTHVALPLPDLTP